MEAKRSSKDENDRMSLPEDIIFDVLVRLPVIALCRFRCVSKAWRAIISEPAFVAAQRSHAGRLIVAAFGSWWPDIELRLLDMQGNVLTVFEARGCYDHRSTRMDLILVNRKWQGATIIDPAARRTFTIGRHAPVEEIWWSDYSFGRAAPSGAYKVLRLSESHATVICEVGTITDDGAEPTWRQTPTPDLFNGFSTQCNATVNGVLYFMPYRVYGRPNLLAAFDLESEVWMDTINAPPLEMPEPDHSWITALTELKETLCMVHSIKRTGNLGIWVYCDIWRLIDHNTGIWVKAHRIRLPAGCSYTVVLDVLDDDGKIIFMNRIWSQFVLQFFDPSTETFVDIMKMAEKFMGEMTFYDGSLLSS